MSEMSSVARRMLALLFVVIAIAFVTLSLAIYARAFSPVTKVTLVTDRVGYALPRDADVKVRGVLVGKVARVRPEGSKVAVDLELKPKLAEQIPAGSTARLLPKTLFGERFVEIKAAGQVQRDHLRNGDVIAQDAAGNSVELDQLLDGLLPVLQAVPPEELMSTLGALSQALQGNGERIGVSLAQLGVVFDGISEELPSLESGLQDLATFTQTYTEAVPDLIASLDAMRTTSATVVERRDALAGSLQSMTAGAGDLATFLEANGRNLINLAADSRQTMDYLARYSPSLPCTVMQFKTSYDRSDAIVGKGTESPGVRVTVEQSNPRGRYIPNQDEPRFFENRGPVCYPAPKPGENFGQGPHGGIADGSYLGPSRNPGPAELPELPDPRNTDPAVTGQRTRGSVPSAPGRFVPERPNRPLPPSMNSQPMAYVGSPLETETVRTVYGAARNSAPDAVPAWIAQLGAPALRGAEVSLG